MKVILKGALGSPQLRQFYCKPCKAWFEAWTKLGDDGPEKRTHACGNLCESGIPPGSKIAIRGGEWNSVRPEQRKLMQSYMKLTDNEARSLTREQIDKFMAKRDLHMVSASWDDNVNGGRRERGDLVDMPPDTDDVSEVRRWNEQKYGPDVVREQQQKTRAAFEAMQRGDPAPALPRADKPDVHDKPHVINVEETVKAVEAAALKPAERKLVVER